MAFDATGLDPTGSGSKGKAKLMTYVTADAQATVAAANYFNAVASIITTGDVAYVFSTTANTATFYRLIKTGVNITSVALFVAA